MMIDKFVKLVKNQISFHAYSSEKSKDTEQHLKQLTLKNNFSELLEALLLIQEASQKYDVASIKDLLALLEKPKQQANFSSDITPADLEGLPPEILEKLELSESDKYEFQILSIIKNVGGTASIRKIMLELYKLTGEMPDKTMLNNKLYRMTKSSLYKSSMGKGFYSTSDDGSSQNSDIDDLL